MCNPLRLLAIILKCLLVFFLLSASFSWTIVAWLVLSFSLFFFLFIITKSCQCIPWECWNLLTFCSPSCSYWFSPVNAIKTPTFCLSATNWPPFHLKSKSFLLFSTDPCFYILLKEAQTCLNFKFTCVETTSLIWQNTKNIYFF